MEIHVELAIFAIGQLGALIWLLSGMRADLKNLTVWVTKIDTRSDANAIETADLRGRLEGIARAARG